MSFPQQNDLQEVEDMEVDEEDNDFTNNIFNDFANLDNDFANINNDFANNINNDFANNINNDLANNINNDLANNINNDLTNNINNDLANNINNDLANNINNDVANNINNGLTNNINNDVANNINNDLANNINSNIDTNNGEGERFEDDVEESARSEATFRFTVENISRLREHVFSPPTFVRNLPWKIKVVRQSDRKFSSWNVSLGLYIQCNGEVKSSSWSCTAVANLKLVSHKPGCEISRKISHTFHSKENDWGFSNFIDWPGLVDQAKGFIINDSITLEAQVKAEAPHGVDWDSKKHAGYVGLMNQGATCYMNSLLQTLFFTNQLRKAVYNLPTESDDSTKSVALSLQRVFFELQYSDKPVETNKLTRSFGWESRDSFMQHDVQEFLRVILDKLENKMKGTCVEGNIPKLFEGTMSSFIKCKYVQYESSHPETFYDIQLPVKGKKDIYESFKDYVATEVLDGVNKYDAGSYGLQDAEKGVIFTSFPPVLHLHLMRFQYDPIKDSSLKSNDRFEFFEKIKLDDYFKIKDSPLNNTEEKQTAEYTLHAVLVHSGDNHGGHYVVFVNPKGDGKWCKFDDDVVARCTKTEAIENNFGGQEMDDFHPGVKQSTNAYMLVYIRDSELDQVLKDVTEDDIPRELLERLKEEKNIEILKKKEESEAHLYMTVPVITEDGFFGHQGSDLYDIEKMSPATLAYFKSFRVLKTTLLSGFLSTLAEAYGVREHRIRIWPFTQGANNTLRPAFLDVVGEGGKSLKDTLYTTKNRPVYLEMLPVSCPIDQALPLFDSVNDVIIFIKMYDPITETLHYLGHWCTPIDTILNEVANECRRLAGFDEDVSITLYEEISSGTIERIVDLSRSLDQGLEELMDGDIIVFHRNFEPNKKYKSLCDFYIYIQYICEIIFEDKNNSTENFSIEMSLKSSYMEMATKVGQRIGIDPLYLQFFKCQLNKDYPAYQIKYEPESGDGIDLLNILAPAYKTTRTKSSYKIFYQILGIPITELEHKKQFKLAFYTPSDNSECELVFYVAKAPQLTIRDVLAELGRAVGKEGTRLRMVEIYLHKIINFVHEDTSANIIQNNSSANRYYRGEEISQELEVGPSENLVQVAHFHKEPYTRFGIPFLIKVRIGEPWSDVLTRVQARLGVNEKDWEKMRVAHVVDGKAFFLNKGANGLVPAQAFSTLAPNFTSRPWIGLEYVNPKASEPKRTEKAIKIYN